MLYNILLIFKYLKFLTIGCLILFSLYNLVSALLIILSNTYKKDIIIFNYYPKFIRDRLKFLMKIRTYESYNIFIILYLKSALYSFILLILFILINYYLFI